MTAKHTPGPWHKAGQGNGKKQLPIYGDRIEIAVLTHGSLADANLIAAAPYLYAALKDCVTEAGAVAGRDHKSAMRRLEAINGAALVALHLAEVGTQ